ncbi:MULTISPECIES: ABC transporter ATP-binding protein [Pseudonocardia]|uniref:Aliphatic sulfonates import ATP-binding protein SsuB n=2 Tax=Pseudonocardia TaxID=1847 RepID=A0A1Y2N7X5_PSEAH|nr:MULTISPECIES: ABC transporter ATP-binding protein [Pseudonocardia]OSY43289.1 Aliphatic sulfonates import ATP-binding protein SsuB [Pseudonocardia autotrophica]TDN71777.1 NitT/TauT family transport system ATP-binding protein [Pseudonocardia autotrophica]
MTQDTAPRTAGDLASRAVGIRVSGVDKVYPTRRGEVHALSSIDLEVGRGEFVSLVGRSGCGKTTLLRILSGLLAPSAGSVEAGGRPAWVAGRRDDAVFAEFGLVFQEANLFPWFTVAENVGLPLKLRGAGKAARRARAAELCATVGLSGFEESYPRELSGGMRQRAAIARALACDPSVLLMDEPFGALDALTRDRMNLELQQIHAVSGATVVFVTHSIPEAVFLADRVVLLTPRPGRIRSVVPVGLARPRAAGVESEQEFGEIVAGLRRELDRED